VDYARRVVAADQAAVQLRRDLHRLAMEVAQAANAWLRSLEQAASYGRSPAMNAVEAERVRSIPADPTGQGAFSER
jgi:hypothetical protein